MQRAPSVDWFLQPALLMNTTATQNRKLTQGAVENLATAVVVLDESLRINYLNPAAEMLIGASWRKVSGRPLAELLPESHQLLNTLLECVESGQTVTERELVLPLLDGRRVTVDCTATVLADSFQGRGLLVEMQQLDRHLRIAREEHLLSQQQATSALLRGLAHEIRNPLGGLRGAAQLLERELDNETLKEYTQVIISEADRLEDLLNRMLGPRGNRERTSINIHEVMERVRMLIRAEVPDSIQIVTNYDPSIPDLQADRDQLIQALLNIARNAAQALGEEGRITLQTRIERQFTIGNIRHRLVARIDIIDDGPGIPPTMLEQIFYPMVTGRDEGSGLGLSIAQSLINQHGGLVECTSQPGHTEFTVRLPLESSNGHP
ncbi:MAG: two-component system sensor histidine kinase NtrB [Gammaproteobacteria bacterium]